MESGTPPRRHLAPPDRLGFMRPLPCRPAFALLSFAWLGQCVVLATEPGPGLPEAAEASQAALPPSSNDPMGGVGEKPENEKAGPDSSATVSDPWGQSPAQDQANHEAEKKKLPPLTPELANLNLAEDLELVTLDTKEKVFLPAGTYRQILRIPIDSPTMQATQKTRRERRPEVKVLDSLPADLNPESKPLWIRYESLEKIKINDEERRGGLDVPIHGPASVKMRLWYAKSETADTASSVFYFVFGGLGYGVANLAGWSAGNTREIPGDFEYRLIRR